MSAIIGPTPACPDLPPRLAFAVVDAAVNMGSTAIRRLQAAIGTSQRRPPLPSRAIRSTGEAHASRIQFMAGLDTWKDFGRGWSRRPAKLALQAGHHWQMHESADLFILALAGISNGPAWAGGVLVF